MCQSIALAVSILSNLVRGLDSTLLLNCSSVWCRSSVSFCLRNKNHRKTFLVTVLKSWMQSAIKTEFIYVFEKSGGLWGRVDLPFPWTGPCCVSGQCPASPLPVKDKDTETIFFCVSLVLPTNTGQCSQKHAGVLWGQVMWSTLCFCLSYCMLQEDNDEGVFHSKGNKAKLDDVCGCPVCKLSLFFSSVFK